MTRSGPRRFINPTLLAFIVAGSITAGLAYMVLSAGSSLLPERPDPVGTAIAAPTEQAMATVEPTRPPGHTPVPTEPGSNAVAQIGGDQQPDDPADDPAPTEPGADPSPTAVPTQSAPTAEPTVRVVNVVPPAATATVAPTREPSTEAPATAAPTEAPADPASTEAAPTEAAVTQEAAPTAPAMVAAPTAAVEIIQLPPVDQSAPEVAAAPDPAQSQAPAQTMSEPTVAPATGETSPTNGGVPAAPGGTGQPAPGGSQPGATELLFPTSVAGNPGGTGSGSGPVTGNVPGSPGNAGPAVVGAPTQAAIEAIPTQVAQAMPTPAGIAADDAEANPALAAAPPSRNRDRTEELRDCIEQRARGQGRGQGQNEGRGRNRNRDNQNENQQQNQNQGNGNGNGNGNRNSDDRGRCGGDENLAGVSTDDMVDQIGQDIRDDVNDRLRAAGIDPED